MLYTVRCYRSANTVRITLNTPLRMALRARPQDVLKIEEAREGVFEIVNLTERARHKRGEG